MKYLMLGWGVGVAGGQLYAMKKVEYLLSRNIDVYLGYSAPNVSKNDEYRGIVLEPLKRIPSDNILEISYPPAYFSPMRVMKVVNRLLSLIDYHEGDEVVVESGGCEFSYWGELVAKKTKGKNFCFLLEGYFKIEQRAEPFFRFKLSRKEIAGTRAASLPQIFKDGISASENRWFAAYGGNSLSEQDDFDCNSVLEGNTLDDFDIKIANVGRSSKPYVESLPTEIAAVTSHYKDSKVLF